VKVTHTQTHTHIDQTTQLSDQSIFSFDEWIDGWGRKFVVSLIGNDLINT